MTVTEKNDNFIQAIIKQQKTRERNPSLKQEVKDDSNYTIKNRCELAN